MDIFFVHPFLVKKISRLFAGRFIMQVKGFEPPRDCSH